MPATLVNAGASLGVGFSGALGGVTDSGRSLVSGLANFIVQFQTV